MVVYKKQFHSTHVTDSGMSRQNMPRLVRYRPTLIAGICLALSLCISASAYAAGSLQDITFASLPGDRIQVKMSFSSTAAEPGSFTINNPARIALDFPDTANRLGWKSKNIGIGFAKSVTAVEAGNRTRVILNLVQLLPFETRVEGSNVYVVLSGGVAATQQEGSSVVAAAISTAVPGDSTVNSITNIDFRRGANGEGRIVVSLSNENTPVSTGESGNQIFVDFGNTGLPDQLQQRLDVNDFATPVQYIDANRTGNRVRLAITPSGRYEYLAYHSGKSYTIEVKPVIKSKTDEKKDLADGGYTGEKLSLNFQSIDVRAVLQLIADFTNLNLVTSDSVKGSLTLRLKNVPWDQALDIILKTKSLGMRKTGNVLLIAPSDEIAAREKQELEALKQLEELAPLQTELITINYAKAAVIAGLVKAKGTGVMSARGSTSIDARTNTLIVVDTPDRLLEVRKLIGKLDIAVRQVMIESRIVIANNTFAKDLGAKFGVTGVSNKDTLVTTSGSLTANGTVIDQAVSNGTPLTSITPGSLSNRLNVNLPAAAANPGAFALSILSGSTLLDLELQALQTDGKGEIVSNPRVITANGQKAAIMQGTEIPYQAATSSGATSVQFKEAVVSMDVTPQITPDDRVTLELEVKKDGLNGGFVQGTPIIDTKSVKTQVLVDNGDTVVLGGIYEQTVTDATTKVPFLGDLPFLGALFRSKNSKDEKQELLIFVTPKILKQDFKGTETP